MRSCGDFRRGATGTVSTRFDSGVSSVRRTSGLNVRRISGGELSKARPGVMGALACSRARDRGGKATDRSRSRDLRKVIPLRVTSLVNVIGATVLADAPITRTPPR